MILSLNDSWAAPYARLRNDSSPKSFSRYDACHGRQSMTSRSTSAVVNAAGINEPPGAARLPRRRRGRWRAVRPRSPSSASTGATTRRSRCSPRTSPSPSRSSRGSWARRRRSWSPRSTSWRRRASSPVAAPSATVDARSCELTDEGRAMLAPCRRDRREPSSPSMLRRRSARTSAPRCTTRCAARWPSSRSPPERSGLAEALAPLLLALALRERADEEHDERDAHDDRLLQGHDQAADRLVGRRRVRPQ